MTRPTARAHQTVAEALDRLAPGLPRFERGAILDHARDAPGLRHASPEESAWLSLTAFVRHQYTEYDDLLADGYDVDSARHAIADDMRNVMAAWGVKRSL